MTNSVQGSTYGGMLHLQRNDSLSAGVRAAALADSMSHTASDANCLNDQADSGMVREAYDLRRPFASVTGASTSPLVSGGASPEAVAAVMEFDTIQNYQWIDLDKTRPALRAARRQLQEADFCLTTLSHFKAEKFNDGNFRAGAFAARVNNDLRALLTDCSRLARLMTDDARKAPMSGELRMHAAIDECRRSLDCLGAGVDGLIHRAGDLDPGFVLDADCIAMLAELGRHSVT